MRHRMRLGIAILPALLVSSAITGTFKNDATENFGELEALAREVRRDAAKLEIFTDLPELYEAESHEQKLLRIKTNVNEMAGIVEKLHKNRSNLEKWQSELVNRLIGKMSSLAGNTDAAIRFADDNPEELFTPNYESFVADMYDQSNSIVKTVDVFLEWANARAEKQKVTELR